jgi:hypothetical protein
VAAKLGISRNAVNLKIWRGSLPAVKINEKCYVVHRADVEPLLVKQARRQAKQLVAK